MIGEVQSTGAGPADPARLPLGVILGTSRSGSTWLGAIVGAHPDVAYRFEPFHRAAQDPAMRPIRHVLESGRLSVNDLDGLYRCLLRASPITEKPPFFSKRYRTRFAFGRSVAWPLARALGPLGALFGWLYSPLDRPPVVFKDVNIEQHVPSLVAAEVRVVYLLRHPCAVISSHLEGQKRRTMTATREQNVAQKLAACPPLLARFGPGLERMTKVQRRALLWRISVDQVFDPLDPRVLAVVYENLCRNTRPEVERVLTHLGLGMHPQVDAFLANSTSPGLATRLWYGEIGINRYFSVFRDPTETVDRWRREMPESDRAQVMEIVADSPGYRFGCEHAGWGL
jgi:hypothetical protein